MRRENYLQKLIETEMWNIEKQINEMWERVAESVKRTAKEIIGENRGIMPKNK